MALRVLEAGTLVDDYAVEGPSDQLLVAVVYEPLDVVPVDDVKVGIGCEGFPSLGGGAHYDGDPELPEVVPLSGLACPGVAGD